MCGPRAAQVEDRVGPLAEQREQAHVKRHAAGEEFWSQSFKEKEELALGATMLVQIQRGPTKIRWETSGTVVDALEHSSYLLVIGGSGGIRKQRGSFLKSMLAHKDILVRQSNKTLGTWGWLSGKGHRLMHL